MNSNELGFYIHIPFCLSRCKYCSFTSTVYNSEIASLYVDALIQEIKNKSIKYADRILSTIYIGGGTPTILSEKQIEEIISTIYNFFILPKKIEITIEANPGTLNLNKLKTLKKLGINRLSIGAQAFQEDLLKLLGRRHSVSDIYDSYKFARSAGFDNINIDLLFAIPDQTQKYWMETLKKLTELSPDHISTYNLTYEHGTKLDSYLKKGKLIPKTSDMEFIMYQYGINFLKQNNYNQYEISNFSHSKKECIHNLIYWENKDYLGVGLGAVSCLNNIRYFNTKNIKTYINKIAMNKSASVQKEYITHEKQIKEAIMLGLRLTKGISKEKFKTSFGISIDELFEKEIKKLTDGKFIKNNSKYLKLTRRGIYLNNDVLTEFM